MSTRGKITCSLLVMIGLIYTYMAFQSNENKLSYSFVAIYGLIYAFLVTKKNSI